MQRSQSIENYLKAIYELQQETPWVSTSALAERLSNKPASITKMIKKLATPELKLLEHVPYKGVRLTEAGQSEALEIIRHHRLIELYLAEVMGIPWDAVHAEAELIEHVISEDIEERMAAALGYPTFDPHGSPIPGKDGDMLERQVIMMTEMEVDQSATIAEVYDEDAQLLRYVGELGLYPNEVVTLLSKEPFNGPLKILLNKTSDIQTVGQAVAKQISVMPLVLK